MKTNTGLVGGLVVAALFAGVLTGCGNSYYLATPHNAKRDAIHDWKSCPATIFSASMSIGGDKDKAEKPKDVDASKACETARDLLKKDSTTLEDVMKPLEGAKGAEVAWNKSIIFEAFWKCDDAKKAAAEAGGKDGPGRVKDLEANCKLD